MIIILKNNLIWLYGIAPKILSVIIHKNKYRKYKFYVKPRITDISMKKIWNSNDKLFYHLLFMLLQWYSHSFYDQVTANCSF